MSRNKCKSSSDVIDEKMVEVICSYNTDCSTTGRVLKNKAKIMKHVKSCAKDVNNNVEEAWKNDGGNRKTSHLMLIQEKARSLDEDLKEKHVNLHNIIVSGEAMSEDTTKVLMKVCYLPKQVFNVYEIRLYWKRIQDQSYISKKEKLMPGYKTAKDSITVLFDGNASSDMKLKSGSLLVLWKNNPKKDLPLNSLLLLDSDPGHSLFMGDFHLNIKVVHVPLNNTLLMQPMAQLSLSCYLYHSFFHQAVKANGKSGTILQQFWKNYNIYKTIKDIGFAWCEVIAITILGVWKNLYPQFVHDFCGFEKMDKQSKEVFSNLVTLNDKLEVDLQEDNFTELLAVQHKEPQRKDREREEEEEGTEEPEIQDIEKDKAHDPNQEWYTNVTAAIHNPIWCHHVYDEKKRATTQTSLDNFLRG
ncbi:hypothetical protein FD755_019794 [Muntiacus reevesi]|uniref:DDE-1 domain-containing protein n=1 Tax=Muntiacus reevesi TaxID=9886 RepID=A0A5N3X3J3_MUNRE|nr:hypothetical protein FD755_019794 [Muntiacus reevesi]